MVLVEIVGGGSNPFSHFTPLVPAISSYYSTLSNSSQTLFARRSKNPTLSKKDCESNFDQRLSKLALLTGLEE